MKLRSAGVTLAEVIIASAITILVILLTLAISVAVSNFTQSALLSRIIDSQVTAGGDAITKELRDGIAVLPSAVIRGKSFVTSSTCVVFSATGYDFSQSNPILGSTDTVAFAFASDRSQVTRTCMTGTGSKRPISFETKVASVTSAQFTYRVSEVIEWMNPSGTTVSETFRLATVPAEKPVCTRNGTSIPCTWQTATQTLSVQVPSGPSVIGIQYRVTPSPSSCPHITSVELQSKRSTPNVNPSAASTEHITEARLRNKR